MQPSSAQTTAATASLYWHDYETWGVNPLVDRPAQFAGLRTDLSLQPIGKPMTLFNQPTADFLPHPEAALITGITPQQALNQGMNECSFSGKIAEQFTQPQTVIVGYNNIRFDDEVTRALFYRNFIDPYAHTWQQGNSRWDLIDLVRACYALRPDGIQWPRHEDGRVSMKLEDLTAANGIDHGQAHDAMADVYATIAIARLIREQQPKLWDYAFNLRTKKAVQQQIDLLQRKPLVHVSGHYGAAQGYVSYLMPLAYHPQQANVLLGWDLRHDPRAIANLSIDQLRERFYLPKAEREQQQLASVALHKVAINRCPFIAPSNVLSDERGAHFGLDKAQCLQHYQQLQADAELRERLIDALSENDYPAPADDPELQLYSGDFFGEQDKSNMRLIREADPEQLAGMQFNFVDARLPTLLFRYRARNFPATLSEQELQRWQRFCQQRLMEPLAGALSIEEYALKLEHLAEQHSGDANKLAILRALYQYAQSL
ncbi:exodeoxyribonuclease I [Idiomarina xiamenensis]|uniref:Exodeoxyribonuclease I n=1 Tax=Idiomarina xiamenensis 10-D-4 TaxID=740709 RepID=K2KFY1_9GAMM|nr:exodeoxyribonuclease I [Idiomarina xiamenensis]EKE86918.1 exonuclease I [Idiomarina xiamenensis 10-D-4]